MLLLYLRQRLTCPFGARTLKVLCGYGAENVARDFGKDVGLDGAEEFDHGVFHLGHDRVVQVEGWGGMALLEFCVVSSQ